MTPAGALVERRTRLRGRENGASTGGFDRSATSPARFDGASLDGRAAGLDGAVVARHDNGASPDGRAAGRDGAVVARHDNGASPDGRAAGLDGAVVAFNESVLADSGALRRNARTLHAACTELLPGYTAASREPWRQALLTAGCLDARPRPGRARRHAPPLIVEDVVQPSDVLCALWLARRCGLFFPGSACGDGVGLRSACEIVPSFAPFVTEGRRAGVLETLRANTAWRAHLLARAAA